jgi:hypothetical protein
MLRAWRVSGGRLNHAPVGTAAADELVMLALGRAPGRHFLRAPHVDLAEVRRILPLEARNP